MRKLIFLVLPLMLAACNEQGTKREPNVRNTFEVDGCQVKYIDPPNLPNFYIARCGNTTTNTWQQSSGKSTTTYATVNVDTTDELRKRLADAEARDKAMAKLSAEDKKALGVK
jgi:uncharacterized lipoprotein YehR (DUF1307 family)